MANITLVGLTLGFPLSSWLQKFPGLSRGIFPGPSHMPAMLKYEDKQQLLWSTGQSPGSQRFLAYTDKI